MGVPRVITIVQMGNIANNGQIMAVEWMEDRPNTAGTYLLLQCTSKSKFLFISVEPASSVVLLIEL